PYDSWVQPGRIARIHAGHDYGPEDQIFAGVHRMTECWLCLAGELLDEAADLARGGQHGPSARRADRAAAVLGFLAEHIRVLDLMVLEDYHPLRVALKGSSGAQSSAAAQVTQKAGALIRSLPETVARAGSDLVQVSRAPHEHPELHELMEATA